MGMYEKKVAGIVSVFLLIAVFAMIKLSNARFSTPLPTSFSVENSELLSSSHRIINEG
jgi:hypothetical protein